jgi:outer membrane protein assembly factor BamB
MVEKLHYILLALISIGWSNQVVADWPQLRGAHGDGHSQAENLPTNWGGILDPYEWQCKLPGRGWSSPIVIGDSVWLTAAEVTGIPDDGSKEKLAFDPEGPLYFQTHGEVSCFAIEIDLATGKLIRKIDLLTVQSPPPIHGMNSYASPTPAGNERLIVFHFGSLGTTAVDLATGKTLWKRAFAIEEITGPASSPILVDGLVILINDGANEQYVIALDQKSGDTVWKAPRPPMTVRDKQFRRAFSTPTLIEYEGRKQLLAPTAQWLVSYDPVTGKEWWRCKTADGYSVVPQAAYYEGIAFVSTGFMKPELWAIRVDGEGDVSESHVLWKSTRQAPDIASPIIVNDRLYTISTRGVLNCFDAKNGQLKWQQRMEGSYGASPIYASGKLYVVSQVGVTTVIQPGEIYQELARNETFGETLATFAVAKDRILIRTDPILYSVRNHQRD